MATIKKYSEFTNEKGIRIALIERISDTETIPEPYVVVYNFDPKTQTWDYGCYYMNWNGAVKHFETLFKQYCEEFQKSLLIGPNEEGKLFATLLDCNDAISDWKFLCPDSVAVTGNRRYNDYIEIEAWETMLEYFDYPDDIEDPELSKFFTELGNNDSIDWKQKYALALSKLTGRQYAVATLTGSSQDQWNYCYYPVDSWKPKHLHELEQDYFGDLYTYELREGNSTETQIICCYSDDPEEAIKEIAKYSGYDPEDIVINEEK